MYSSVTTQPGYSIHFPVKIADIYDSPGPFSVHDHGYNYQ